MGRSWKPTSGLGTNSPADQGHVDRAAPHRAMSAAIALRKSSRSCGARAERSWLSSLVTSRWKAVASAPSMRRQAHRRGSHSPSCSPRTWPATLPTLSTRPVWTGSASTRLGPAGKRPGDRADFRAAARPADPGADHPGRPDQRSGGGGGEVQPHGEGHGRDAALVPDRPIRRRPDSPTRGVRPGTHRRGCDRSAQPQPRTHHRGLGRPTTWPPCWQSICLAVDRLGVKAHLLPAAATAQCFG